MYFVLRTTDSIKFIVCSKHRNLLKAISSAAQCEKDDGGAHWIARMSRKHTLLPWEEQ